MKKLFIISAISLFVIGNSFTQEQIINSLSTAEDLLFKHKETQKDQINMAGTEGDNLLDSIVSYYYFGPDSTRQAKTQYFYDERGNQTLSVEYIKQFGQNQLDLSTKMEFYYDEEGNQTLSTSYYWDNDMEKWIGNEKIEIYYDDSDHQTSSEQYSWDIETNEWILQYMWEYNYGGLSNLTSIFGFEWNNESEEWDEFNKTEYYYDSEDQLTSSISAVYNSSSNDYKAINKLEYSYDDSGNQLFQAQYRWDSDMGWIGLAKKVYQYKDKGVISFSTLYSWSTRSNDWSLITTHKDFYFYSSNTGIKNISDKDIVLFPNPTTGIINITGLTQPAEVKIYSIHGQLLKSEYQVENTIDISNLKPGVYFLKLNSGKTFLNSTILKN